MPRPPAPAPELRASRDLPGLHALDRPTLTPRLRVPEPPEPTVEDAPPPAIPTPKTFEELAKAIEALQGRAAPEEEPEREPDAPPAAEAAEDHPGFAAEIAPALTSEEFLQSRVRHCFEEVSMIGMQRAPLLGDPWRASLILERRMLASIDAIVAMGPASVALIEPLVLDSPAKDAARVFGTGMVMGCLLGRDAFAVAERAFLAFEVGDPASAAAFAGALKLVPHPSLPVVMRAWLADADPARRALAIDVLGYRRLAAVDELARAAADEPLVAAAALPHYAVTRHGGVTPAIQAALASESLPLRQSAWLAMAITSDLRAAAVLRTELAGGAGVPAALPLAIVGDARDAALLLERAVATQDPTLITAVGWAGAATAIPVLIELLRRVTDDEVKLTVAYALERITGAEMYEQTLVPPEKILVPDAPEPDLAGELAPPPARLAALGDPRDLPGDGAPDLLDQPTVDHARWLAYWREKEAHFQPALRFRRGWPYTPLVSLRELDRWRCTPGERRLLQRELIARTGRWVHFDPHDFVVVQEASLREWEPFVQRASGQPGAWSMPSPR